MIAAQPRIVLVVEDDDSLRPLYRSILLEAGYKVVALGDGFSALEYIDAGQVPHAVLLDLKLPRVSGWDVAAELRARSHTRHIPVVVVTGTDVEASDVDAECLLRKPVGPESLVHAIEECLKHKRATR